MPVTPPAIAQNAASLQPVAAATSAQSSGAIPNSLQRVQNAQAYDVPVAAPRQPGTGNAAWRPWEAPARLWRPYEPAAAAAPACVAAGVHARWEPAFCEFLKEFHPRLFVATEWLVSAPADCTLSEFSKGRLSRPPHQYANAMRMQTERGKAMLELMRGVFDLALLGFGEFIPRPEFEAFAESKGLNAKQLGRQLALARERLPHGSLQFPKILDPPSPRAEQAASLRRTHAAALSNPSNAFLQHLHLVNQPLELALQWSTSSPASRPAPSFHHFANCGSTSRLYVSSNSDNDGLTDRGVLTFAFELAAFDLIRMGHLESRLTGLALSRGLDPCMVRWYATRAKKKLRAAAATAT